VKNRKPAYANKRAEITNDSCIIKLITLSARVTKSHTEHSGSPEPPPHGTRPAASAEIGKKEKMRIKTIPIVTRKAAVVGIEICFMMCLII
jgi:hypothetical protein